MSELSLAGRTIAVPETRELDVFTAMLERRGANVLRCPLIAIKDAPDPAPVLAWIRSFNAGRCTDLILLTGEGLRRLLSCIDQHAPELREGFLQQLQRVRKITRGPKPARVLRDLGMRSDIAAVIPTTDGVIAALRGESLQGRSVGVQLYGTEPNRPLIEFLQAAGATTHSVAPYVYADAADEQAVHDLLTRMASGEVDAIAFTSTPQVQRLFAVGPAQLLRDAFARTRVAAVGPLVAERLEHHGIKISAMPDDSYFLKPLTNALVTSLGQADPSERSGGDASLPPH